MSEDQQQLLELRESSNTQLTETGPSPENPTAELVDTEILNTTTNDDSFKLVGSEGKSGGLQLEEESSGEQRGTESPVTPRMSGRRSSLVPFFNRRSSFTPSYFKPLWLPAAVRKSGGSGTSAKRYTSLHTSRQRLVFEEQEEEEKEEEEEEDQQVEGGRGEEREGVRGEEKEEKEEEEDQQVEGGRGEEREIMRGEGERGEGRRESGEEKRPLIRRVGQSFKKTLQNLKLFLT